MVIAYSPEEFKRVKSLGEEEYRNIDKVYCPYFKNFISFNSEGFNHLTFKRRNKIRTEKDQYMRFKLIHLAPVILGTSYTIQGILETKKFEKISINSRKDLLLVPVNYFEFISVIERNKVKVIVKQVNNGERFFWSIIPFWHMNRDTMTRLLHEGYPEED